MIAIFKMQIVAAFLHVYREIQMQDKSDSTEQ